MIRHFCATGFVVHSNSVLLHWHRKVQAWLPPGGHIEANEDPVQATVREVMEETGIRVSVVPTSVRLAIGNLDQVDTPFSVMIEDVIDQAHGPHQHIDFIYFTVPVGEPGAPPEGWVLVSERDLRNGAPIAREGGSSVAPPEDVIKLGLEAISTVRRFVADFPLPAGAG